MMAPLWGAGPLAASALCRFAERSPRAYRNTEIRLGALTRTADRKLRRAVTSDRMEDISKAFSTAFELIVTWNPDSARDRRSFPRGELDRCRPGRRDRLPLGAAVALVPFPGRRLIVVLL